MKMQFCPYCGTKLDEGARFCKNCGESVVNKTFSKETSESEPVDEAPETKRKTVMTVKYINALIVAKYLRHLI